MTDESFDALLRPLSSDLVRPDGPAHYCDDERRFVARHEAGHMAAGKAFGLRTHGRIAPDRFQGQVQFDDSIGSEGYLVFKVAGPVASRLFYNGNDLGSDRDYDDARRLAERDGMPPLQWAEMAALDIVKGNQAWIERKADELFNKGEAWG